MKRIISSIIIMIMISLISLNVYAGSEYKHIQKDGWDSKGEYTTTDVENALKEYGYKTSAGRVKKNTDGDPSWQQITWNNKAIIEIKSLVKTTDSRTQR